MKKIIKYCIINIGDIMKYPNKVKTNYNKTVTYGNRGMNLENILNITNDYYLNNDIAIIYKKPTPIGIIKTSLDKKKINSAYFKTKSTLDYNGLYKGKYLDFDAKETKSKTSFPLNNLHEHQLIHMLNIIRHGGISFLIILINNCFYLLNGESIKEYLDNNKKKKSIDYNYIKSKGFQLNLKPNGTLDYLSIIEKIYFKENNYEA